MAISLISLGKSKQPLRNVPFHNPILNDNFSRWSANLYERIRQTPELVALLDTVVTDHYGGPVDFFGADGRPLGPTQMKQKRKFWEDENVQGEAFAGQGLDYFVDGSCFGWWASASHGMNSKQKEAIAKLKETEPSLGNFATQRSKMPRKISYLAASTVDIMHDSTGILFYKQEAAGRTVKWNPDQVVHVKQMEFNGEIRGFSSLKALTKEILMMFLLKENILASLQNGGSPDYIISLKGANGVSRARFERLRTALESFSHLRKSHGNMPIDAEVTTHELGTGLKDMEYRELAMFVISEFALALGIPTSRVPFLMTGSGGNSNKGELSGNSEDSYQMKINARRTVWENAWNKVFRQAGFTFRFRRDNLQDDVRETQASTQRAAYVIEVDNSLFKRKQRLKLDAQLALLSGKKKNIEEDDIEDIPKEDLPDENPEQAIGGKPSASIGGKFQPKGLDSRAKVVQDNSAAKKETASNKGINA